MTWLYSHPLAVALAVSLASIAAGGLIVWRSA